jgi:hypothetical protein
LSAVFPPIGDRFDTRLVNSLGIRLPDRMSMVERDPRPRAAPWSLCC